MMGVNVIYFYSTSTIEVKLKITYNEKFLL